MTGNLGRSIIFLFDNNALIDFGNRLEFAPLCDELAKLYNENKVVVEFSPIVFYEQIYNIESEDQFKIARANIRRAYKLTCGGNILVDPQYHLNYTLHRLSIEDMRIRSRDLLETYKIFSNCQNIDEFKAHFANMILIAQRQLLSIYNGFGNV